MTFVLFTVPILFSSDITPLTCFTEEVVAEERNIWGPRYDEYRRASTSLCDRNRPIPKEEKKARFRELDQKYKQVKHRPAHCWLTNS